MKTFHKHLLAGAVALVMGASAFAAGPGMDGESGGRRMRGQRMEQADHDKMIARMQDRMEKRQAVLHDRLKLNAEQEVAWKEFVGNAKPTPMGMRMNRAEMMKLSAPERMEKMLEIMKDRQARLTVRMVALKKFYAALTPEQQKVLDTYTMGPRHGRHHGKHQGRGMGRGAASAAPASAPAVK